MSLVSCTSGDEIGDASIGKRGRTKSSTVSITKLDDDAVDGTLTITFDDGSSVKGRLEILRQNDAVGCGGDPIDRVDGSGAAAGTSKSSRLERTRR